MKQTKVFLILLMFLSSCVENKNMESKKGVDFESIGSNFRTYYFEIKGMNYVFTSNGNAIRNLTLDSLQVEFYKRSINK